MRCVPTLSDLMNVRVSRDLRRRRRRRTARPHP